MSLLGFQAKAAWCLVPACSEPRFRIIAGTGVGQSQFWGIETREGFRRGFQVAEFDETRSGEEIWIGAFDCGRSSTLGRQARVEMGLQM